MGSAVKTPPPLYEVKPLEALAIWLFPGPGIPLPVMVKSCQLKCLIQFNQ